MPKKNIPENITVMFTHHHNQAQHPIINEIYLAYIEEYIAALPISTHRKLVCLEQLALQIKDGL